MPLVPLGATVRPNSVAAEPAPAAADLTNVDVTVSDKAKGAPSDSDPLDKAPLAAEPNGHDQGAPK